MKKEKFIYNTQTLQYEKVEVQISSKIFKWFGLACAILVSGFVLSLFTNNLFLSEQEKMLQRELEQMKAQYKEVDKRMKMHNSVLESIQDRDANVHRMIFGMDPIDKGVWDGGVGGSERYAELKTFEETGELMTTTMMRLDRLSRKMAIQSKSLDSLVMVVKEKDQMLSSLPSIKPVREDKLNKAISQMSGFGIRVHPIYRVRRMHNGIDFSARTGTPIYATGNGTVITKASGMSGYGKNVVLNHGYGYQTLYAHMSQVLVRPGQKVKKGQKIGLVGSTGSSTGPHLHYEVHYKGRPVNPIDYCQDGLKPQEYAQLVELAQTSNLSFD
jgi:uncharacterized membrane-anchored protein YhcB (DUF1043 family)